ncbi:MAG: farnesyl diphosphate synthase [Pseudomonadota bacterium]
MTDAVMNFDLVEYLTDRRGVINTHLETIFRTCRQDRILTKAMQHSLMAGGKRLRPVLCMAAAEAVCGNAALSLPFACAVEMVHTYSLIHDDLPAMDNDDLRRGIPTCHKQFNEATAILAGDGLLTHAFLVLATPENWFTSYPEKSILLQLIALLADAAGINGMIEGQMMDMQAQGKKNNDKTESVDSILTYLKSMHDLKTGRMIVASVDAGAISSGALPEIRESLSSYARNLGLAFQVTDDILNIEGDPEKMGKAAGSDALNDKMTFPALLGLESSKKFAADLVDRAIHSLSDFGGSRALALTAIARYVLKRKR